MSGEPHDPLISLSSRLNAPLALEEALRAVCEEAGRALGAPVVILDLYDERRELFYPAAAVGLRPEQMARVSIRPRAHFRDAAMNAWPPSPNAESSARGEAFPHYAQDAFGRELDAEWGGRLLARARIERAGQPLGSLNVFSHIAGQRDFTQGASSARPAEPVRGHARRRRSQGEG